VCNQSRVEKIYFLAITISGVARIQLSEVSA
jgi:hypothetical protein